MDSSSASKTTWSDAETRAIIHLWEEHLPDLRRAKRNLKVYAAIAENLQALGFDKSTKEVKKKIENLGNKYRLIKRKDTGTGSGAISWPYYWEIHRFLGTLPLHDQTLAQESSCCQTSPAEVILEGIARGDPLQDNQSSDGCPSPLPGMACCPPPCASPPEAGNSCLQSPPDTGTAGPSCEAGLDVSCTNPATKKRKRQPAPSTLVMQLLDEQRQLRISSEPRKDRELQLREEQLKVFKQIASIDERLLSVLEKLANK
ncbi:hypothetical protein HPB49_023084 [Dermacentor silvarum]|uniref:Uncharacterized protein n=1 Tax=Dermacentor silvarum TaxID=543639 RepID=A0ACB8D0M8_DERSI|nr:myb/SANT-like DNA-binding domain-containing protein 1 [Dermacentor silvarum]KAH7954943.1 hypothetical protein HPB49_023084 [Dermacentor silvarum]